MIDVRRRLLAEQDPSFRDFQRRLLPNLPPEKILGVYTPRMRALARELSQDADAEAFLADLPHLYHEENCVHAFLLETIRDYDACADRVEAFLPYIDNWATCDQLSPKVFGRNREALLHRIKVWVCAEHPYTVRFGVGMLMRWYLDDAFSEEYPQIVANIRSDEYYVRMMAAWYFATALAKQYDAILPYLEQNRLDPWTRRKAIQKAIESRRIPAEQKAYLKSLRTTSP